MIAFTAVFDAYDRLKEPPPGGAVIFTDTPPPARFGWDVRLTPWPDANPARSNRYFKLQPHHELEAERVLYFDARLKLRITPAELLARFQRQAGGDHDVFTLQHSLGHDLAREFEWVHEKRMTSAEVLDAQEARYRELGVPFDVETCQASIIIARLNDRARAFLDAWWGEVKAYSHRDQLAFPYAKRVTNADVHLVPHAYARESWVGRAHAKPQLRSAT